MHRRSHNTHLVHIVWATKYRAALILPSDDRWIAETVSQLVFAEYCRPLGIGGSDDHVHALVEFPSTCRISELVQRMKGASSHAWNQRTTRRLDWQDGYWSETFSPDAIDKLRRYVANQRIHHATIDEPEPWEAFFRRPLSSKGGEPSRRAQIRSVR